MKENLKIYILIIAVGIILFIPYLGEVHLFDWDEVNFAEAAREMVVTGDYFSVMIDYEPFHEKPPLFFWMQALSMKVFGVNEFAARFPNAIIGIITLLFIFKIGEKLFDYRFGLLWVLVYIGSFLPHFYFKTGIIDPTFNLFMFASVYFLSGHIYRLMRDNTTEKKYKGLLAAGIMVSLAVMTKGPVGYLLPALTFFVFWFIYRKQLRFPLKSFLLFTLIAAVIPLAWYINVFIRTGGKDIIEDFILYQLRLLTTHDAGHAGPVYYHFVVLFFGCFPASVFMLRGFRKQDEETAPQNQFKKWNIILLFVVLVVFTIVRTKIIHYSSLAYFPITFLAANAMYGIAYRSLSWKTSTNWFLGVIGFIYAAAFTLMPLVLMNVDLILPRVKDKFTYAVLQTPAGWGGYEFLIGIILLAAMVVSIVLFIKAKYLNGYMYLYGGIALVIFLFLPLTVPRIEAYVQGTAVAFYKSMKGKDVYVEPLDIGNYKYGHYFYTAKPESLSFYKKGIPHKDIKKWLLTGRIDHPALFITKNTKYKKYVEKYGLKKIGEANGFVFLVRYPHFH